MYPTNSCMRRVVCHSRPQTPTIAHQRSSNSCNLKWVSWCYKQCFDSKFPQVCSKPWSHLLSTVAKATHWVAKAWRGAWDKSGPLLKCTQLQYIIYNDLWVFAVSWKSENRVYNYPKFPSLWSLTASCIERCLGLPEPLWGEELSGGTLRGPCRLGLVMEKPWNNWVWVNTYRYIFSGMNIHLPAILMFTRGTRFWHTAMQWNNSFPVRKNHEKPWTTQVKPSHSPCWSWDLDEGNSPWADVANSWDMIPSIVIKKNT